MCAWIMIFLKVWEVFVTVGVFFMVSVQVWEVFMGNYFCLWEVLVGYGLF